jgi:hypothetical protein
VVWWRGRGSNFYVTMVPVENTEGPNLLSQKGREAETDGSSGARGARHPACAGGKVRPGPGGRRWPGDRCARGPRAVRVRGARA